MKLSRLFWMCLKFDSNFQYAPAWTNNFDLCNPSTSLFHLYPCFNLDLDSSIHAICWNQETLGRNKGSNWTMTKFFHIYADGKRVREISWEQYRKLSRSKVHYALCRLHKNEIGFSKGSNWIWLSLRQLKEILREWSLTWKDSENGKRKVKARWKSKFNLTWEREQG